MIAVAAGVWWYLKKHPATATAVPNLAASSNAGQGLSTLLGGAGAPPVGSKKPKPVRTRMPKVSNKSRHPMALPEVP
jgi:hypothetical protein